MSTKSSSWGSSDDSNHYDSTESSKDGEEQQIEGGDQKIVIFKLGSADDSGSEGNYEKRGMGDIELDRNERFTPSQNATRISAESSSSESQNQPGKQTQPIAEAAKSDSSSHRSSSSINKKVDGENVGTDEVIDPEDSLTSSHSHDKAEQSTSSSSSKSSTSSTSSPSPAIMEQPEGLGKQTDEEKAEPEPENQIPQPTADNTEFKAKAAEIKEVEGEDSWDGDTSSSFQVEKEQAASDKQSTSDSKKAKGSNESAGDNQVSSSTSIDVSADGDNNEPIRQTQQTETCIKTLNQTGDDSPSSSTSSESSSSSSSSKPLGHSSSAERPDVTSNVKPTGTFVNTSKQTGAGSPKYFSPYNPQTRDDGKKSISISTSTSVQAPTTAKAKATASTATTTATTNKSPKHKQDTQQDDTRGAYDSYRNNQQIQEPTAQTDTEMSGFGIIGARSVQRAPQVRGLAFENIGTTNQNWVGTQPGETGQVTFETIEKLRRKLGTLRRQSAALQATAHDSLLEHANSVFDENKSLTDQLRQKERELEGLNKLLTDKNDLIQSYQKDEYQKCKTHTEVTEERIDNGFKNIKRYETIIQKIDKFFVLLQGAYAKAQSVNYTIAQIASPNVVGMPGYNNTPPGTNVSGCGCSGSGMGVGVKGVSGMALTPGEVAPSSTNLSPGYGIALTGMNGDISTLSPTTILSGMPTLKNGIISVADLEGVILDAYRNELTLKELLASYEARYEEIERKNSAVERDIEESTSKYARTIKNKKILENKEKKLRSRLKADNTTVSEKREELKRIEGNLGKLIAELRNLGYDVESNNPIGQEYSDVSVSSSDSHSVDDGEHSNHEE